MAHALIYFSSNNIQFVSLEFNQSPTPNVDFLLIKPWKNVPIQMIKTVIIHPPVTHALIMFLHMGHEILTQNSCLDSIMAQAFRCPIYNDINCNNPPTCDPCSGYVSPEPTLYPPHCAALQMPPR